MTLLLAQDVALRVGQPLKMLQHFGGFDGQRRRQVIQWIELPPIPPGSEAAQVSLQLLKSGVHPGALRAIVVAV